MITTGPWPVARIATGRVISTLTELRLVPLGLIIFFYQFYPYVMGQDVSLFTEQMVH